MDSGGRHYSKGIGVLIGMGLLLVIGTAIYPLRNHDYELQILLVLPVVYAGALSGRVAALVTAALAVVAYHYVTSSAFEAPKLGEDAIALGTFLASALAVGAAVGGRADRLSLAAQHEEERRVRDLIEQVAAKQSRLELFEQVDRQRVALLRSVSHDLRTPLATIRAVATDLRDDNVHDEAMRHELLDSVSSEAERLDRLVGNLLSMSRIDAGFLRVETQAVDLGELLQFTVLRLRPLFEGVTLELHVDPTAALVDGDPVLLDQVLSNLLENAARHAPAGSIVSCELSSEGSKVMLAVRDHGPGVSAEDLEYVFQPFWKGSGSRSSGLGLAIVRAIVVAHGGEVEVSDTPGGGATFEIRLLAREDAPRELRDHA